MPGYPIAMTEEAKYPLLRKIISGLPEAFVVWRRAQQNEKDRVESHIPNKASIVTIDPSEFDAWCKRKGVAPSAFELINYVVEKHPNSAR
jgi:hypothetical protein